MEKLILTTVCLPYLIVGAIALIKILKFDRKITNLIEKTRQLEYIERKLESLSFVTKEYNKLNSQFVKIEKERNKLKAEKEYLQGVCDDAKEEFERMNKERK